MRPDGLRALRDAVTHWVTAKGYVRGVTGEKGPSRPAMWYAHRHWGVIREWRAALIGTPAKRKGKGGGYVNFGGLGEE